MYGLETKIRTPQKPSKLIYGPNNGRPSAFLVFSQSLIETAVSFGKDSSLHGVTHIVEAINKITARKATHSQRIFYSLSLTIWISAFVLGAMFAITLMDLVWQRFQRTPTITTVETNNYPIWNVQFPAVTICNNNKVHRPSAQPIIDKLVRKGLPNDEVMNFMGNLSKLIKSEYSKYDFRPVLDSLRSMNYTTERLMLELMQPCDSMLSNCAWLGKEIPCKHLFRVAKSSEGFCCSFNYKAPLDFLEIVANNETEEQLDDPVFRVSGAGPHVGLNALIDVSSRSYVSYCKPYFGALILVHGPQMFPQDVDKATFGQPGCDVTVPVIPSVVVSELAIRNLELEKRDCYFDDEKKLRTTSKYSYKSCILECAVDTILRTCNCLPFYFAETRLRPFFDGMRQCTLSDSFCLREFRHIFNSLQPDDNSSQINGTSGMQCMECLPSCSEESYTAQAVIARREGVNLDSLIYPNINLSEVISLKVHFRDMSCIKYRRDIYLTWDGLLASFGGIFGLCLGGSVLSLVEFVYFFTFKLWSNLWWKRKSTQATAERLAELGRKRNSRVGHLLSGGVQLGSIGVDPKTNETGTNFRKRRAAISVVSDHRFVADNGKPFRI